MPRRALEREVRTLVETRTLYKMLHALIEMCYENAAIAADEQSWTASIDAENWIAAARDLTTAETRARRHAL